MNILVVDDENALRRTIRTTLERQGHVVAEATTGSQAVERVAASPTLEDAARTLGIDPSTLSRKRKRYGL